MQHDGRVSFPALTSATQSNFTLEREGQQGEHLAAIDANQVKQPPGLLT